MKKILNLIKFYKEKPQRIIVKFLTKYGKKISDINYIKILFFIYLGKKINLKNPKTVQEKLQWLKLNDHNPSYINLVDKIKVKEYVSNIIGKQYIIPTIKIYNDASEINYDELPEKFIIKCNHNSGCYYICNNKKFINPDFIKEKFNRALKRNYYYVFREFPYKNVKPQILIEKFIEDNNNSEIADYKFYCFEGEPKYLVVIQNRKNKNKSYDYFDLDWNHLEFCDVGEKNAKEIPLKPKKFDEMISIVKKLSKGLKHVRIDLYYVKDHIYFGEITFYDASGFNKYYPKQYNKILGDYINLS